MTPQRCISQKNRLAFPPRKQISHYSNPKMSASVVIDAGFVFSDLVESLFSPNREIPMLEHASIDGGTSSLVKRKG